MDAAAKSVILNAMTIHTHIESLLGKLLLTSRQNKLTGLYFADRPGGRIGRDWIEREDADIFIQTKRQLDDYAAGERTDFDLPLGLAGTSFQMRVWLKISAIPFGQTLSYGDLAKQLGMPRAVRAVGAAAGQNPVCWIVPCHRVVGKDGSLTGYAGGIPRKKALLEFEAAKSAGEEAVLALGENQRALALA
jgi:O-6-methylguanine DNA methyltransferase